MQRCLEAEWFYFGLHFCYVRTQAGEHPQFVPLAVFKERISTDIATVIRKDLGELQNRSVGGKNAYKAGLFVRRPDTYIYVYQHGTSATCSGTKYSQIEGCVEISCGDKSAPVLKCCHHPAEHYSLLPFYYDNETVLELYKELEGQEGQGQEGQEGQEAQGSPLKAEVQLLENIVRGAASPKGTPYETPAASYTLNWHENDWTR